MNIGVRFTERMSGWVEWEQAHPHHDIELSRRYPFEVRLNILSFRPLRWSRPRQMTGRALFLGFKGDVGTPILENAPLVSGTLTTRVTGVDYDFQVDAKDLGILRVKGSKIYGFSLKSFIELPIEIFQGPRRVARGRLVYREPIWKFILGVRPVFRADSTEVHLSLSQHILRAMRILVPAHAHRASIPEVTRQLLVLIRRMDFKTRAFFWIAAGCIRIISWLLSFVFDASKIADIISHTRLIKDLSFALSAVGLSALYCSDHKCLPVAHEGERWMSMHRLPSVPVTASVDEMTVDAIVIGSGAGGAAAAYALASAGHAVVILEEGAFFKRPDLGGSRVEMMARLYRAGGFSFPISNAPLWLPTGKSVGGTTTINCGTCMRPSDRVLQAWEDATGIPIEEWPLYFSRVEETLDAKSVSDHLHGPIRGIVERGMRDTQAQTRVLKRAETGCDGHTSCIFGCPTGAKRSTNVSYVPEALKKNALLLTGYRVRRLILEGDTVTGAFASLPGYDEEFCVQIKARMVFVATGTLETPQLLRRSGIGTHLPMLGKNLTIHPAVNVGASFSEVVRAQHYVPQSLGVFGIENGIILEGHTLAVDEIPMSVPLFGQRLTDIIDAADHFTNFAAMLDDTSTGRVISIGGDRKFVYYPLNKSALRRLHRAVCELAEMLFRAGAKQVFAPIRGFEIISSREDLERLKRKTPPSWDFFALSGHHPLGTCRMGSSPRNSVTDRDGRVWGINGLRIVDGSVIPGPIGANPQVSIMANALRIVARANQELT